MPYVEVVACVFDFMTRATDAAFVPIPGTDVGVENILTLFEQAGD